MDWKKHRVDDKKIQQNEISSPNNHSNDNESFQKFEKCYCTPEEGCRMDQPKHCGNKKKQHNEWDQ